MKKNLLFLASSNFVIQHRMDPMNEYISFQSLATERKYKKNSAMNQLRFEKILANISNILENICKFYYGCNKVEEAQTETSTLIINCDYSEHNNSSPNITGRTHRPYCTHQRTSSHVDEVCDILSCEI